MNLIGPTGPYEGPHSKFQDVGDSLMMSFWPARTSLSPDHSCHNNPLRALGFRGPLLLLILSQKSSKLARLGNLDPCHVIWAKINFHVYAQLHRYLSNSLINSKLEINQKFTPLKTVCRACRINKWVKSNILINYLAFSMNKHY